MNLKGVKNKLIENKTDLVVLISFIIAILLAFSTIGIEIFSGISNNKGVISSYYLKSGEESNPFLADGGNESGAITITKTIDSGNNSNIYQGQIQQFKITVKNNTEYEIKNITVKDQIPDDLIYAKEITNEGLENRWEEDPNISEVNKTIDTIAPQGSKTLKYFVRVKKSDENVNKQIETKATATIENDSYIYESNIVKNTIKESKLQIDLQLVDNRSLSFFQESQICYFAKIKNLSNETITGLKVKDILPQDVTFVESNYLYYDEEQDLFYENLGEPRMTDNYNQETRTVEFDIGSIEPGKQKGVQILVILNPVEENVKEKVITNRIIANTDTEQFYSNMIDVIEQNNISVEIEKSTNLKENFVYEGDEFEYILKIKNNNKYDINNLDVIDTLPDGVTGIKIISEKSSVDDDGSGNQHPGYAIGGEEIDTEASGLVINDYDENQEEQQNQNNQNNEEGNTNNNTNAETEKTESSISILSKKIKYSTSLDSGETETIRIVVSADELNEGVEELEIKNIAKVEGMDLNETTSNEVTNIIKKKPKQNDDDGVKEDSDGIRRYEINPDDKEEREQREENRNDNPEEEKEKEKEENNNQNEEEINNNEEKEKEEEEKENQKREKNKEKFDLKLNKYISKISIKDPKGTKITEYNNTSLAKVEIPAKTINNTTITIEYKIVVTNEGEVAGYANKIIDYLPNGLEFSKANNLEWKNNKGELITEELDDELIEPGVSKEITLILTKNMDENNTGTDTNIAEIYESASKKGNNDIDSKVNNKELKEDDISSADLIISIKTGKVLVYFILITSSITILSCGIYLIKKKVLA